MLIVGKELLARFGERHADIRPALDAWICEVDDSDWRSPTDIKARYPSVSILSDNKVIFNIKGNKYRIETKVSFEIKVVLVTRIGTHSEYSKWTS
jgi:mRNA interferase HigB